MLVLWQFLDWKLSIEIETFGKGQTISSKRGPFQTRSPKPFGLYNARFRRLKMTVSKHPNSLSPNMSSTSTLTDEAVDAMVREHGVDLTGSIEPELRHRASAQIHQDDEQAPNDSAEEEEDTQAIVQVFAKNPLPEVSLTSVLLGVVGGVAGLLSIQTFLAGGFWQFPFYVTSLATFHFLEYYITASYNLPKVKASSFLLRNGNQYLFAHALAITETLIELYLTPASWTITRGVGITAFAGLALLLSGQFLRSAAMIHAATNFSHVIVRSREQKHELVRTGVYSFSRHPSYCGFFFWALGTQILLANPISFVIFFVLLWKFFNERIKDEELYLLVFFGEEYVDYRKTTPTRIPFIN